MREKGRKRDIVRKIERERVRKNEREKENKKERRKTEIRHLLKIEDIYEPRKTETPGSFRWKAVHEIQLKHRACRNPFNALLHQ